LHISEDWQLPNPEKAVILASGGLDSTVTAALAKSEGYAIYLLTISYGQRHQREVMQARQIAQWLEAQEHKIMELDLRLFGGSALTANVQVPSNRSSQQREKGIPITYVPARNTIFLSLGLAYAEVLEASRIYFGANIRDYSGYPDCRPEYVKAFMEVARLGTRMGVEGKKIEILTPLIHMNKVEIIQQGIALGVPFHLTHSCYGPGENGSPCGRCDSCVIRREGFRKLGMEDPVASVSSVGRHER
jgi:7-cyano-7-deazaguanine synthase